MSPFPRLGRPPPAPARPWREGEYCAVDVETTGLDLAEDAIVSYGAVLVRSGRVVVAERAYGLVRPGRPVSVSSVSVHTLRDADLADAVGQEEAAGVVQQLLHGRVLVAHAVWIERALLDRALRARGARLRGPYVDTAALARAAGLADAGSRREPSLELVADRLGVPAHSPHHALGDALTTAQVFVVLASRLERAGRAATVRDLVRLSHRHRRAP